MASTLTLLPSTLLSKEQIWAKPPLQIKSQGRPLPAPALPQHAPNPGQPLPHSKCGLS